MVKSKLCWHEVKIKKFLRMIALSVEQKVNNLKFKGSNQAIAGIG